MAMVIRTIYTSTPHVVPTGVKLGMLVCVGWGAWMWLRRCMEGR
jgi:hypothetical protein